MNYSASPFLVQLSFDRVIDELQKVAVSSSGERAEEAKQLLADISLYPELRTGLDEEWQVEEHADLIHRLMRNYFPLELSHNEIKAIGIPYLKMIFNHSDRFKRILAAAGDDFEINIRDFDEHQFYVLSCCLILNEIYGTELDFAKPLFYDIPMANGVLKHYRILYNADYLEIFPTGRSLAITPEDVELLLDNYDNLALWKEKFPEGSWLLKGFSLMTLVDVTVENAVSLLKEKLLVLNSLNFQQSLESIFRSIYKIPDIHVGFTLYNQQKGIFKVADFGQKMKSFILKEGQVTCDKEVLCYNSFQHLIGEQTFFAISDTNEFSLAKPTSGLGPLLLDQGIHSIILAPMMKNGVLLGVLELVSPRRKELNSINALKLEIVMPFLSDSIDKLIAELHNQVQAFIQDKYTTIHPSVYWKFKEDAERALTEINAGHEIEPEEILFSDVFPLYGQIDIKESSEARNLSVQNDLKHQLSVLENVLKEISPACDEKDFSEQKLQIKAFQSDLIMPLRANTEQQIKNYLLNKIEHNLKRFAKNNPLPVIANYFNESVKETGSFHLNRRKYESSISTINQKLAVVIDKRQQEAQLIFPHYYERFKTDGLEHNLYVGASIAPDRHFDLQLLHQLRLWQIRVLCEMENAHYLLKRKIPYPLEVTTLILVFNSQIDIRFRMDEKRFDVDGSYNARFEIVKKRIDKALVKGTKERITQTGKITVVYSNEADEMEYKRYLGILQAEGLLEPELEMFDVEDLQGVSGMKALRATFLH